MTYYVYALSITYLSNGVVRRSGVGDMHMSLSSCVLPILLSPSLLPIPSMPLVSLNLSLPLPHAHGMHTPSLESVSFDIVACRRKKKNTCGGGLGWVVLWHAWHGPSLFGSLARWVLPGGGLEVGTGSEATLLPPHLVAWGGGGGRWPFVSSRQAWEGGGTPDHPTTTLSWPHATVSHAFFQAGRPPLLLLGFCLPATLPSCLPFFPSLAPCRATILSEKGPCLPGIPCPCPMPYALGGGTDRNRQHQTGHASPALPTSLPAMPPCLLLCYLWIALPCHTWQANFWHSADSAKTQTHLPARHSTLGGD